MSRWDSDLYLRYAEERTQPSIDLIARIHVADPARIIDLGCGPGNSTAILRQRWPNADITGLDNSAEMITSASQTYPTEKWVLADIASWSAEAPFDLVFSNAALHWLPDHAQLFPHLLAQVAPGGALAIQMPAHLQAPLHQVILEAADAPDWSPLMDAARKAITKETPLFYYDVLQPVAAHLDLWTTEYYHVMDSHQSIVDWIRATGMRPFLDALQTEEDKQRFLDQVREGYTRAYPQQNDGRVLLPFRRVFIVAYQQA